MVYWSVATGGALASRNNDHIRVILILISCHETKKENKIISRLIGHLPEELLVRLYFQQKRKPSKWANVSHLTIMWFQLIIFLLIHANKLICLVENKLIQKIFRYQLVNCHIFVTNLQQKIYIWLKSKHQSEIKMGQRNNITS